MGLFDIFQKNKKKSDINLQGKKATFYKVAQRFFDIELLREIYSDDKISICNLANSYYLAFPFETIDGENVVGVVADADGVRKIMQNHRYVYKMAYSYRNNRKYIVVLNDDLINAFLPIKEKREKEGRVSPGIDLALEAELLAKTKAKQPIPPISAPPFVSFSAEVEGEGTMEAYGYFYKSDMAEQFEDWKKEQKK